jgi:hypothetical protein
VRVPTDTPPGNNAPHAERTAELIKAWGFDAESTPCPSRGARLRHAEHHQPDRAPALRQRRQNHRPERPRRRGAARRRLDARPLRRRDRDGQLYGRAAPSARATSPPSPSPCARWKPWPGPRGAVELHFTYDEEFGGLLGPGWLLEKGLTRPDLMIAAGFSYEVVTAHNGCLQMEVTVHGKMAHAAVPTPASTRCRRRCSS